MGATYQKRGKGSWRVAVHWNGDREYKTVHSEADARALIQMIHKQELAGVNVVESIRAARAAVAPSVVPSHPRLRDAIAEWLESQASSREIRTSTAAMYASRLRTWVYGHALPDGRRLGDLPVDQVTRAQIGAAILAIKAAGRSASVVHQVRNAVKGFFEHLVETKTLNVNPANDLKHFIGRIGRRKSTALEFFSQEEGPRLIEAARALFPRWSAFILTGLLAGLRWGESAALYRSDVDFARGRIHVQRTLGRDRRTAPPKNGRDRWVKASPALLEALHEHLDAVALEGQVNQWTPEQRELVFPNGAGQPAHHTQFLSRVWRPLLAKAGLPYRKYHATRHSYATWMLSDGADVRFVQAQLGHASITLTVDTYGHLQPERHEAAVEGLDRYV